jgi:hypothetical protein
MGSTEPRCGQSATSPWSAGHVLVHLQKLFCLHVQQRWCSRYPMPKGAARNLVPSQVAWPAGQTSGPMAQSSAIAPPYSFYKYHGAPLDRKYEETKV